MEERDIAIITVSSVIFVFICIPVILITVCYEPIKCCCRNTVEPQRMQRINSIYENSIT
jgi:hypothetical protein